MISVIVPCYNSEATIMTCCESLFKQTYQQFELILLDDGSTDDTYNCLLAIKNKYQMHDIVVASHPNCGVSGTRNRGLSLAKGDYVAFVDADDQVESGFLENLVAGYESSDIDLSIVGVKKSIYAYSDKEHAVIVKDKDEFFRDIFHDDNVKGYMWNKLYRMSVIRDQHLTLNTELSIMEDLEFNLRYLQFVRRVACSNQRLYCYIIGDNSAMTSSWSDNKMSLIRTFDKIFDLGYADYQRELIIIEYVRALLWLVGQLYRKGTSEAIRQQEPIIFQQLALYKKIFLKKGYQSGWKYYLAYLVFCSHPSLLKLVIR